MKTSKWKEGRGSVDLSPGARETNLDRSLSGAAGQQESLQGAHAGQSSFRKSGLDRVERARSRPRAPESNPLKCCSLVPPCSRIGSAPAKPYEARGALSWGGPYAAENAV
jgi:hypothetical protein